MSQETVLIVGATGNIGVAATLAVLRSKRNVLALVRNQDSAAKLINYIGSDKGITIVEVNVISPDGVQGVVDQVKAGKLPAFQHVIAAAGGAYSEAKLHEISTEDLHWTIETNFTSNFYAYRATIPYLLEQGNPNASWILQTGFQGEIALRAAPAMSLSALFGMATAAIRELKDTNIRFNEVRLGMRVETDAAAETHGSHKSSKYANVLEKVLNSPEMRDGLIRVLEPDGLENWKFEQNQSALLQIAMPMVHAGTFQTRK